MQIDLTEFAYMRGLKSQLQGWVMRGSIYYQSSYLVKLIFKEGVKKEQKIDENNELYKCVSSYKTMESYRVIWNNFFIFLRRRYDIKDCMKIEENHIESYMYNKIVKQRSQQYLEKISSAFGKLEDALNKHLLMHKLNYKRYDFSIRKKTLKKAIKFGLLHSVWHNRAYEKPLSLIKSLTMLEHQLAATIQLESGTRLEGVGLIKKEQLSGLFDDKISGQVVGRIRTKEKGGKEWMILMHTSTYNQLNAFFMINDQFKINRQAYLKDIRNASKKLAIKANGSHGFRWSFAKKRMFEHAQANYTYEQSLQMVSWEMKHNRASITNHYLTGV